MRAVALVCTVGVMLLLSLRAVSEKSSQQARASETRTHLDNILVSASVIAYLQALQDSKVVFPHWKPDQEKTQIQVPRIDVPFLRGIQTDPHIQKCILPVLSPLRAIMISTNSHHTIFFANFKRLAAGNDQHGNLFQDNDLVASRIARLALMRLERALGEAKVKALNHQIRLSDKEQQTRRENVEEWDNEMQQCT
eukprot:GHVU01070493.1.p1 GENE.GHVU01070493.1~~GHVU01070493.1.p1  ORF type:complete len:195 (-),score=11.36 GHVU01070493.1:885-1469(-)